MQWSPQVWPSCVVLLLACGGRKNGREENGVYLYRVRFLALSMVLALLALTQWVTFANSGCVLMHELW